MVTRRTYLALFALAALWLGPGLTAAAAIEAGQARTFIQSLGDEAITTLTRSELTANAREAKFRRLLRQGFAIEGIAKFVLGRYWRTITTDQRRRYLNAFEELIVKTYAARFEQYNGDSFRVTGERPDGEAGRLVESEINQSSGPPLKVQWRVREGSEGLKIVDILVEGVSLAVTQRSEFAAVVQRHGGSVDALIEELESKVKALK